MSLKDYTRTNDFDRIVGRLQAESIIKLGVGNSILDVGCGIGEYTQLFHSRFQRVVGIDPEPKCLLEARSIDKKTEYLEGRGETFDLEEDFDTIALSHVLEHVDNPVLVLGNCKRHLRYGGRIIVQVPNKNSIARRLGVLMGVIPSVRNISDREANFSGHKRTYDLDSLSCDCLEAGLNVVGWGGILYKPLPNEMLWKAYVEKGEKFIQALLEFGEDRPEDCACIYVYCGL